MAYEVVLSVTGFRQVIDECRTTDEALALARAQEAKGSWQVTIVALATGTAYTPNGFEEVMMRPSQKQEGGP